MSDRLTQDPYPGQQPSDCPYGGNGVIFVRPNPSGIDLPEEGVEYCSFCGVPLRQVKRKNIKAPWHVLYGGTVPDPYDPPREEKLFAAVEVTAHHLNTNPMVVPLILDNQELAAIVGEPYRSEK